LWLSSFSSVDEPHIDIQLPVDLAIVVDRDDVFVVWLRHGFGLVAEPLYEGVITAQISRQ
jgi:hypothetical protein